MTTEAGSETRPDTGVQTSAATTTPSRLLLREGDLLSQEQLTRHAQDLAASHRLARHAGSRLLDRLEDQERVIVSTIAMLSDRSLARDRIPPAGDWLLDNSHVVLDQIRLARRHLPRSYSRQLPVLASQRDPGVPRVYALATEYIGHVDGRLDPENLSAFLGAYQVRQPLTIGELWAVPIALRLALIHTVERVCHSIRAYLAEHARAERWAARVLKTAEAAPRDVLLIVADLAREGADLTPAFVAEFMRRMGGQHASVSVAASWIESRLHGESDTIAGFIQRDHQTRAADQVTMAATIGSMRLLDSIDWPDFVEAASHIERILYDDPAGWYARMDFATRDRYRHVIEDLARGGGVDECTIARAAVTLAGSPDSDGPRRHVGWWLIGDGVDRLAAEVGTPFPLRTRLTRGLRRFGLGALVLPALLLACTGAAALAFGLVVGGLLTPVAGIAVAVVAALAWSGPALAVMQRILSVVVPPHPLPRIDLQRGITKAFRTVVAVPCLISRPQDVDRLLAQMELRFLANRDPDLTFLLLSDFRDAATESTPADEALLAHAVAATEQLNQRYQADGRPFGLLHRPRRWNPAEGVWMGWERKRGKLDELNRFLFDGARDAFNRIVVDQARLDGVRSVIVLDADTQLPPGAAWRLVGALAHPLNRPVVDPRRRMVVSGHGLIQPGIATTTTSALASRYAALQSGEPGLDPYTRAVSDTYQDLFDEGSFVGKGIYDLATFDGLMHGRFPDNRILSHDLIEGNYLRSGLDSETTLLEDYPARYLADQARRHRWTRGDWQVARWILPRPPTAAGREPNHLSLLARWKLADNLRRGLALPAWTALLIAAALLPQAWPGLVLLAVWFLPTVAQILVGILGGPADLGIATWAGEVLRGAGRSLRQGILDLAWLPHETRTTVDAILRTTWRLLISHRRLLEWTTAADAERTAATTVPGVIAAMWAGPALGLGTVIAAHLLGTVSPLPCILGALWTGSGFLAAWLSAASGEGETSLSQSERRDFLRLARQTYAYFEDFCGADQGYLPPDNIHLDAGPAIAHRTSPTNLGLKLLADLGAHDLGFIGMGRLVENVGGTLRRMDQLERHRGHFFNWYDTRNGAVLEPHYLSTVDSGNLVGHLLVLRQGLLAAGSQPLWSAAILDALESTWTITVAALAAGSRPASPDQRKAVSEVLARLREAAPAVPTLADIDRLATLVQDLAHGAGGAAEGWPRRLAAQVAGLRDEVASLGLAGLGGDSRAATLGGIAEADGPGSERAQALLAELAELAELAGQLAEADFSFLIDPLRGQFTIGYHVGEHRSDRSCYDLLASEARLASYLAIARGQVPHDHWFRLGRPITDTGSGRSLVSWSGSMFEFLMPNLVMPSTPRTLLAETCRSVIQRQQRYARARGIPWGISESGYNLTDRDLVYQYRAFGVPGLGFKRGLSEDVVVAPYACLMAAPIAPQAVHRNLRRLIEDGAACAYGFVEAIDYTPARIPPGQDLAVVRQVMVHHQGMAFLALVQALADSPMQRRFRADPELRSVELLLEERVPRLAKAVEPNASETAASDGPLRSDEAPLRVINDPSRRDEVALLANGSYQVMVDAGGGGWSRWNGLALTRWREDSTVAGHGLFTYLRDLDGGVAWSPSFHPVRNDEAPGEAIFTQGRAEFRRRYRSLECHSEIAVSPEDDVEVRRLWIRNLGRRPRRIEITTYAEVVLQPQSADEAHPAFGNLFIQTEVVRERGALLATRRARKPGDRSPWLFHQMSVAGGETPFSWTTDRATFLGRGGTVARPAAMGRRGPLDGAVGAVLDPAVAIRRVVEIPPEGTALIDIVLGAAEDRGSIDHLLDKFSDRRCCDRVFDLAWTHAQIVLRQIGIGERDAQRFARLAGSLIHPNPVRRAPSAVIARNRRGRRGLWGYGISGDLPLVFVRVENAEHLGLVRSIAQAHAWWRTKGLPVDLFILVDDLSAYRQELAESVRDLIAAGPPGDVLDKAGGVFVRRGDQVEDEDRTMLQAIARVVLPGRNGSLADQIDRHVRLPERIGPDEIRRAAPASVDAPLARRDDLAFRNRWGGFTQDGREYVLVLGAGERPPAPWINVLANEHFGAIVSESGAGYTWIENSHEFRITPWYNDPVTDRSGEAFYLRDERSGRVWSPTPGPVGGAGNWVVRHGFGYSVFEHCQDAIASELWTYVAVDAPVRFFSFTIRNHGTEDRRIAVAGFVEWVLGEHRHRHAPDLVVGRDARSGALTARNHLHDDFPERIAFLDCSAKERSITGDRAEFLGVGRGTDDPAGMARATLSNRLGAGMDPGGAMTTVLDIPAGEERKVVFLLGVASGEADLNELSQRFRSPSQARRALEAVWKHWNHILGGVHVETPDHTVDHLVNGWLMYQVLASRVWGRTGFYQSGGAFGFRDQLQDTMALVHAVPDLTRQQILRSAGRQFREGDVQHWWHPPTGRGVRTRFSDDLLWLPLALARYVDATGRADFLDEMVPFLEGRPVAVEEEGYYDRPEIAGDHGSLLEHGARAIDLACSRIGPRGLPLIGCGDWNDGMNLVGIHGRGESVWLAFFLVEVIKVFLPLAEERGMAERAARWRRASASIVAAVEREAWDGEWYRRATMDDGTWIGTKDGVECRIDSLPQSWAVMTGAGDPERARRGLEAVDRLLVRRKDRLIQLFDPPFDKGPVEPGYIKGYLPGVRENGGQYTHAALWTVMAFARERDAARAWELFGLINPVNHADTPEHAAIYRVEPYVISADVYGNEPHTGRGGWSWYTGSAGWCYRLLVEDLFGLRIQGDRLTLRPLLNPAWDGCVVHLRHGDATFYHLHYHRRRAGTEILAVTADGKDCPDGVVQLRDDGNHHQVEVEIG